MAGGVLLALGSFLAWATAMGDSVTGMDGGNGWFTLVAGAALVVFGVLTASGTGYPSWLPWLALSVGTLVAVINLVDITGLDGVSIGIGMWIVLAGVVVAVVGLSTGPRSAA
jgi:hypothetical protein